MLLSSTFHYLISNFTDLKSVNINNDEGRQETAGKKYGNDKCCNICLNNMLIRDLEKLLPEKGTNPWLPYFCCLSIYIDEIT